jgi:hypothetical protein
MSSISGGFNFYIEIIKDLNKEKKIEKYKCSNIVCKENRKNGLSFKKSNFCDECGSPIENFPELVKDEPNASDFCNDHLDGDEIITSGFEYSVPSNCWIYNYSIEDILPKTINDFNLDGDGGLIDLSLINISELIELFKKEDPVKSLILKLNQIFGENGYKIKFGFIAGYY